MRFILLLLGIVACLPAIAGVTVSDAWVRGTVEAQTATAAYLHIASDRSVRLTGVSSPVAATAKLHEMKMDKDVMTMRPIESIEVPAGGGVTLDEDGLHVMLEGLRRPLKAGDHVPLELRFIDAAGAPTTIRIDAPVRAIGASSSSMK